MKKAITTICLTGSALIILDSLNLGHQLTLLLLVGLVPWTNIYLSPIDMMAATATAITVIILRVTIWPKTKKYLFGPLIKSTKKSTRRTAKA
jgi:hypothetical protein